MGWTRMSKFTFGKWKGTPICQIETDYLEWCIRTDAGADWMKDYDEFRAAIESEVRARHEAEEEFDEVPVYKPPKPEPAKVFCTVCNDKGTCCSCVRGLKEKLTLTSKAYDKQAAEYRQLQAELAMARRNNSVSMGSTPKSYGAKREAAKEIIAAGRKAVARKYHPDTNKDAGASSRMAECNSAADWLEKATENLPI